LKLLGLVGSSAAEVCVEQARKQRTKAFLIVSCVFLLVGVVGLFSNTVVQ